MVKTHSRLLLSAIAVVLMVGKGPPRHAQEPHDNPFEFFAPWIVVSAAEREGLDRNQVLTRVLPGKHGQLAVFVVTSLNTSPDALVAWTRAIAELKQSKFVRAVRRFSDPPTLSDLDTLTLEQRDLDAIQRCRPGDCGLKLSAGEIESLAAVRATAGAEWRNAVQREFRRLLLQRVQLYRAGGLAALPPLADRGKPRRLDDALAAIVEQSPYLARLPDVASWLQRYPYADAGLESFFYWSNEHYGEGKPVISVTHVGIVRPASDRRLPAILVAGKQIFATHYVEGGLGLTMLLHNAANGGLYLVYVNRTELDLLKGFVGVFARRILEGRIERQAPQIVSGLRTRLESGAPSDDPLSPWSTVEGIGHSRFERSERRPQARIRFLRHLLQPLILPHDP